MLKRLKHYIGDMMSTIIGETFTQKQTISNRSKRPCWVIKNHGDENGIQITFLCRHCRFISSGGSSVDIVGAMCDIMKDRCCRRYERCDSDCPHNITEEEYLNKLKSTIEENRMVDGGFLDVITINETYIADRWKAENKDEKLKMRIKLGRRQVILPDDELTIEYKSMVKIGDADGPKISAIPTRVIITGASGLVETAELMRELEGK